MKIYESRQRIKPTALADLARLGTLSLDSRYSDLHEMQKTCSVIIYQPHECDDNDEVDDRPIDVMNNIDPDIHFYNNTHLTNYKY